MGITRRAAGALLVAGLALGCSTTRNPTSSAMPSPLEPIGSASSAASPAAPSSSGAALPPHRVIAGTDVAGAFDLATDGEVIAWSNGSVDVDAPVLWSLDTATGRTTVVYRSPTPGAILANLAVRQGTYAFAEVTPRADGSRTWRLVVVDPAGRRHVLDTNDLAGSESGLLPMPAISDHGVLWATSHAGDPGRPMCDLRYALLLDLRPRLLMSAPCSQRELWYPRSDGRRFVLGTVEYSNDVGVDERHVELVEESNLTLPRRLDADGQASLPALLDDTVVWKTASPEANMLSPAGLQERSLAAGSEARDIRRSLAAPPLLTTPSLGPGFITGEDTEGLTVRVWDRARSAALDIDRLLPTDPGFVSGTRLSGGILAWFYTSSAHGGGEREIRWLALPAG